jgi:hypothetical protein
MVRGKAKLQRIINASFDFGRGNFSWLRGHGGKREIVKFV